MDAIDPTLVEVSVGLAAAVIILKIMFDFLKPVIDRVTGNKSAQQEVNLARLRAEYDQLKRGFYECSRKIADLHDWHNARTEDGGFRWYVPSALEKAIETLANNISKQTDVLSQVASVQKETCNSLERLERRMEAHRRTDDS